MVIFLEGEHPGSESVVLPVVDDVLLWMTRERVVRVGRVVVCEGECCVGKFDLKLIGKRCHC